MSCAEIGAKVLIGINGSALRVSCSAGVTSQIIGSGHGLRLSQAKLRGTGGEVHNTRQITGTVRSTQDAIYHVLNLGGQLQCMTR